ncbi:hypothetical protein RUM43_012787 [Polyplax serrata]|uniref:Uncharacterized protein n=1 Tax=Polyplax serrata TaxID=468196 RepID=A0AAN8S6I1_POLSC
MNPGVSYNEIIKINDKKTFVQVRQNWPEQLLKKLLVSDTTGLLFRVKLSRQTPTNAFRKILKENKTTVKVRASCEIPLWAIAERMPISTPKYG